MTRKCLVVSGAAALFCFLGASPLFAQGGPPLLTDDPGTPGDGQWEINLAAEIERFPNERVYALPLLDVNYGVGDRIQLKVEVPWVVLDEDGASSKSGLGNMEIGLKWRFLDEAEDGISISTYPQMAFENPTSSVDRGLVEPGTELFLPLQIEKDLGWLVVNPEVGFATREGGDDTWVYGLAVGREVSEGLEVLAEIHGEAERHFHGGEILFNVGMRLDLSDRNTFLVSVGRGIRGASRDEPEFIGYMGIQFTF